MMRGLSYEGVVWYALEVGSDGVAPPLAINSFLNMTFTCFAATVLVLLLLPLHLLMWATESRSTRINRYRAQGQTWKAIADRYGVHPSTVSRWAKA